MTKSNSRSNEHFYQNQIKFDNNIYFNSRINQQPNGGKKNQTKMPPQTHYLNAYTTNPEQQTSLAFASSSSSTASSSGASSDRLLLRNKKDLAVSYCFLLVAILCLTLAFVTILITFIFPFWIRLGIENSTNLTNTQNGLSLQIINTSNESTIYFELGIWEVKMHQSLEFYDTNTRLYYRNAYPQSMNWLNSDLNNQIDSFLIKLLQYMDLKSAYLFSVQILEIIHLIFTFLTLCFTSFTLCLCTTHKSSLCWYLVCFFMCVISFATGLAVLVLLVVWNYSKLPVYKNQLGQEVTLSRSFNWCFWCAVGINTAILVAAFFILLYLLFSLIAMCTGNKKKTRKSLKNVMQIQSNPRRGSQTFQPAIGVDNIGIDFTSQSKLPRIQYATLGPSQLDQSGSRASTVMAQERVLDTTNNSSYIFYTGHGNYRKRSMDLDQVPNTIDYDQAGNLNFSMSSQLHKANSNDHPYSNVADQAHNEFRFTSYR